MHNMSRTQPEGEGIAFSIATESLGLTTFELAEVLSVGAKKPLTAHDVFMVLAGSDTVPNGWWLRLRAYEQRVRQRQSVLALAAASTRYQNITSGVFTFDLNSAFERDAAGRAIRSLSGESRAFVVQRR